MHKSIRALKKIAGIISISALTFSVQAVSLPCSTAKLVVPWGAGGDTDIVFRTFANAINKTGIKPQLQVVNVGGQGGVKGTTQVLKEKPDGCNLIAIHESLITSYLTGRAKFTIDALVPVSLVSYTPSIICASTKAPFKTMKEMLAYAKGHPDAVPVGVSLGSTSHFIFLLIEDAANVKFRYVSYDGTAQRNTALLSGNVMMGETNVLSAKKYINEGSLNALAIALDNRDALIPDVPTLKQTGVQVVYGLSRGIMLPKGTPAAVVAFWEDAISKAAKDPAVIKSITEKGSMVMYKNAGDYGSFLKSSYDTHEKLAIKIGLYKK